MAKAKATPDNQMALLEAVGPIEWVDMDLATEDLPQTQGEPPDAGFVRLIKAYGVNVPIQIYRNPQTRETRIIDGNRRLAAARAVGLEVVPVRAIESESYELALLSLIGNAARSENPAAEYLAIQRLVGIGYGEAQIAAATNMKIPTIRRRLALAGLNEDFLLLFEQGAIRAGVAYQIAKLSKNDQGRLWERYVGGEKLTQSLVREVREVERDPIMGELPEMPDPVWVEHAPERILEAIDAVREAVIRGADILEIDRLLIRVEAGVRARVPGAPAA